ncbi:putative Chaperone protein dnaJ 11, chloroplast precursor [Hibiscus syriacus]|uniref:Chaperone protein dnaJ 11, chloroplast n=1 Tax=Hibiscus syriacus TaxID=106335 RepID=A0A6A2X6M9_HIBSY|nr:protein PSK SIMULATOR 2-like isoform X2 [Hibiscus syriacus]KAE8654049.1 putative Chaperone protein dnaJ 11, chloroplast precursor [Hibiscus syriacus]
MGSVCSGGTKEQNTKVGEKTTTGFSGKLKSIKSFGKKKSNLHLHSGTNGTAVDKARERHDPGGDFESQFSLESEPPAPPRNLIARSSFLGRAGTVGLERAVNVLDSLGSGVSSLNSGSSFVTGLSSRGNKISILSFEVANTIAKGANLLLSLSEENIQFLKNDVLNSEAVQKLVSTNMNELLSIAAADKRDELDAFSREVIRFGDLCKDPQWHNLGRYFSKLDTDNSLPKQTQADADQTMKELTSLAHHTCELYHELNALDRFEQDCRRRLGDIESNLPKIGDSIMLFQSELKQQRKLIRNLKKKSLWSRTLEEIVEKFIDIVTFMHQVIPGAFGASVRKDTTENPRELGVAGLALHYANLINQIDNIAARPTSLPPNVRDTLYHGLPHTVKKGLRSRIQSIDTEGESSISEVKDEMEKTLQWLVPVATNTSKAHQGFGWVGEWANTSIEFGRNEAPNVTLTRLQTLHHADKQKTDEYILELVAWLHHLMNLIKLRDDGIKAHPLRSPTSKGLVSQSKMQRVLSLNGITEPQRTKLSEEVNLLNKAKTRRSIPRISRSQELPLGKSKGIRVLASSRSAGNSPERSFGERKTLKVSHTNILNVLDGLSQPG